MTKDPGTSFDVRRAYDDHGRVLFGFVLNSIGDVAAAEDCVQETFLRAWRHRHRYDPSRSSERTWLFAIARNTIVDSLRSRSRRPTSLSDSRADSLEAHTASIDERMTLVSALAQLSDEHRTVVTAIQLDGMKYQELSDKIGVPVPTLRTRMFYGLKSLRAILGEEGSHD